MAAILYLDDSPLQLATARRALADAGHSVRTASDVRTAREELAAAAIDLVIVDAHLPGRDAAEVVRELARAPGAAPCFLHVVANDASATPPAGAAGVFVRKGDASALVRQLARVLDAGCARGADSELRPAG